MTLKLGNMCLITLIALVALAGCERGQDMVMDVMPPADPMDGTMPDMEAVPVKLMWLIDYPADGKEVYLEWVKSIAPTLQAPEEIARIRSYDNRDAAMSPHRLVEFEFDSFIDAATNIFESPRDR